MQEVDLLRFITAWPNYLYITVACASGAMLIWPMLRSGAGGTSVSTLEATLLINQQNAMVLDVRESAEYEKGHILGARNLPLAHLDARAGDFDKHRAKPVIVVCGTGDRSGKAAAILRRQGFQQVFTLNGGIGAWRQAGLPLEK
jgi:rhodanese-related sulfurtransferase